uniref:Immunoglobulin V-set domain-containing protein n=1 Tax=Suricata suricatta TaxID=37032 RepID=A0A673V7F7_SURSU
ICSCALRRFLWAVSNAVSGPVRGLLTVQCRYDPGWETYKKWWCRGAEWSDCHILVTTNGSEEEAKNNHVSIKDNQKQFTFIVTMEELRWNYEDTYWCGIERYGTDLGVSVKVTIDPGKSMYKCGCVSSGPAQLRALRVLSSDFSVTQSELSHRVVDFLIFACRLLHFFMSGFCL